MSDQLVVRNNVHVMGRGSQSIMFAHGFGCDQAMWRHVVPYFVDDHRLILFDLVGSGRSNLGAWSPAKYASLHGHAADVIEILDHLSTGQPTIFVGHSVSAMIGVLAAIARPDLFAALVLVAPSPRYLNDGAYHGGFEANDIAELLETLESNYLGWSSAMAPVIMANGDRPELADELEASFCTNDPVIARHFARITFTSDNRTDLPCVRVPTLVLQCSEDAIAPEAVGRFTHEAISGSRFVQLAATGHCPNLSAPAETAAAIQYFLDTVPLAGSVSYDSLEGVAHGFVVLDERARIRTANRTFGQWVNDPALLSGTARITACLAPASRIYFDTHVLPQTLMTGQTDAVALDLQCGATRMPMLAWARRLDGEGRVHWTSLTLLPAGDRRRYEQELLAERRNAEAALAGVRQAQQRLLVVSRTAALNVAATSLAHEVNQPLLSAILFLAGAKQLCASGLIDPRIILAIEDASNAVEAAGDVLRDVRRGTKGMQPKSEAVDAQAIINRAWEIADCEMNADRLRIRIPAALPLVICDFEYVAYAVAELVTNALEASRGAESNIVVVEASAGTSGAGDRGTLRIQVDDAGPGLPDDDVFAIGFTTKANHSGLGLANVRTIIEAGGGIVGFASAPTGGCRAFIELPGFAPDGGGALSEATILSPGS